MKVHHLNCGTMHPPRGAPCVCHVLLVETDNGLVLVDSGFGLHDCADPTGRVGPSASSRGRFVPTETAARQVERLGFRREDVRHIVLTHFDIDHIGGLADFPDAQVHVTSAEVVGAFTHRPARRRTGYRRRMGRTAPPSSSTTPTGESWRGFAAAKELDEIAPGIVLVSLPGHTRGHACIAVDAGHRWVLHCGDAFYHYGSLDGTHVPRTLWTMETAVAFDRKKMRDNHSRLAELYRRAEDDLFIVSAHDSALFERAKATGMH